MGDPATKVVQHAQTGVELVVVPDGQLFVWASKKPIVLDVQSVLGLLRGEFKLGTEAAPVVDKLDVLWAVNDDQVMKQASTERTSPEQGCRSLIHQVGSKFVGPGEGEYV